jgi:hypothetical protein
MTKRILKEIQLDRISAVDRPAQSYALACILKRAEEPFDKAFRPEQARDEQGRWTSEGDAAREGRKHQAAAAVVGAGAALLGHHLLNQRGLEGATRAGERFGRRLSAKHGALGSVVGQHLARAAAARFAALPKAKAALLGGGLAALLSALQGDDTTSKRAPMTKEADMTEDEIEKLERDVDTLLERIDKVLHRIHVASPSGHSVTTETDDGENGDASYRDTWSATADANSPGNNASLGDGDGEEDDGDGEDGVAKASVNAYLRTNSEADRPGDLESSTHDKGPHKFLRMAMAIKNDRGIPMSEALAQARTELPDLYADYQRHQGSSVSKAAPTTYEDLVQVEIKKGFSPQLAQSRVANLYGYRGLDHRNITKGEAAGFALEDVADNIWKSDPSLSRTEALRQARFAQPNLYKRMQRV